MERKYYEGDNAFSFEWFIRFVEETFYSQIRVEVQKNLDKYQATMDRLNYKISRYEEALKSGVLTWDAECINKSQGGKET